MVQLQSIAPQFVVPDVRKAAEYYRDVLGFEILGFFLDPPVYAMVRRGGAEIHFGRADEPTPFTNSAVRRDGLDAYIFVDDCDALYREYKNSGAVITQPPIDRSYGRAGDRHPGLLRIPDRVRFVIRALFAARLVS